MNTNRNLMPALIYSLKRQKFVEPNLYIGSPDDFFFEEMLLVSSFSLDDWTDNVFRFWICMRQTAATSNCGYWTMDLRSTTSIVKNPR